MPFSTSNQMPTAAVFLELSALEPCTVPAGRWNVALWAERANMSYVQASRRYQLVMDFERTEWRTTLAYGLSGQSDILLDLPYIHDDGGFMDHFIRAYHDATGLPQSSRARRPDNQYQYTQVDMRSGRSIRLTSPLGGMGEPVLTYRRREGSFGWLWWHDVVWGWRAALKLPQPGISPALGSGAPDAGGGVMVDTYLDSPVGRIAMFGHVSLVYLSPTRAVLFDTERWVPMGGGGFAWLNATGIAPMVQWQLTWPRYSRVPFAALGRPEDLLTVGLQVRARGFTISFAFTEDPNSTSEDFGIVAGLAAPSF